MIQPFIYGKPSHPSQPSRSGVDPACEGFCDGSDNEKNLHSVFEAICEGVTVVKVLRGIKGEKGFYLMTVIIEKMLKIMVMARLAHLARIISHGTKIIAINRQTPVPFAAHIIGGVVTAVDGSADAVIRSPGESYYFTLIRVLGVTPYPLLDPA